MLVEISNAELIDKLSICQIKIDKVHDEKKIANIKKEYDYLFKIVTEKLKISVESEEYSELLKVNQELWNIEDLLRIKEEEKKFDEEFIEFARKVYILNDKRAILKKNINIKYNSIFIEEKSYKNV
jgi:hypothetical protein